MPEDSGMLFDFDADEMPEGPQGGGKKVLYMRDTPIALDVGWFNKDGELQEVTELHPNDETWRWTEKNDEVFGLEMNKGYWDDKPVGETKLDMDQVCDQWGQKSSACKK